MAIPDQCVNTSENFLNSNPSLSSFPCDVLKALGLPNVDPNFQTPKPFDYSIYTTHLERLSSVGDPRWSLGAMFTDLLDNVMPQVVLQTEMLQAGGCQIIDQFICDADGKPLKSTLNTCANSVSGLPISITSKYLQTYIVNKMEEAKTSAADRFIEYLRNNWTSSGWVLALYYQPVYNIFYIKLTKTTITYIKYYPDQKEYLSIKLGLPIQEVGELSVAAGTFDVALRSVLSTPIGSY